MRVDSPISDVLRRVICDSDMTLKALEREAGVQRASLSRFMAGKQSLRLDVADKLAAYFGLRLQPQTKGK